MNFTPTLISEIGQVEEHQDGQRKNQFRESLEFFSSLSFSRFYLFPSATTVPPKTLLSLSAIMIGK